MELIYLYVEKFRNLNKVEFNLGSEVRLHFNYEDNILSCEKNHNSLPRDFWDGNICGLTAIVGNNGAGKTSFMQYINSLCQYIVTGQEMPEHGIIALKEGRKIFYCKIDKDKKLAKGFELKGFEGYIPLRKNLEELKEIVRTVKMIYLTNALAVADYQRNQKNPCERSNFLYDCSIGGLMYLDATFDVNREMRQFYNGTSDLEIYSIYEKYKQIKFVFDKNQFRILEELKKEGYSVPVPRKLYINLLLDNQLQFLVNTEKNSEVLDKIDFELFHKKNSRVAKILLAGRGDEYSIELLQYQFSRCCIWSMVRSITRILNDTQKQFFLQKLEQVAISEETKEYDFRMIADKIWEMGENTVKEEQSDNEDTWERFNIFYKPYYYDFLRYIEYDINWIKHMHIEDGAVKLTRLTGSVQLSVSTQDAEWFMEFLKKYRYVSNPDYFLDFYWGLSSGETNLLSTFASFYYIFDQDHTNEVNGEYVIYNKWNENDTVRCDSVILMADEVDLTFHPEWQREYISLLTAFLVRVYPMSCCKSIQIILSTHSPILLGDIPQQNVIYLRTDYEKGCTVVDDGYHMPTFGQNIHLLLRDNFFLKNGTMGRYAHDKILQCFLGLKNLEERVNNVNKEDNSHNLRMEYQKELEDLKKYASLVAEPIINKKLLMQIERIQKRLSLRIEQFAEGNGEKQNFDLTELSNEALEEQLHLLQKEKERRKNDKDSNI